MVRWQSATVIDRRYMSSNARAVTNRWQGCCDSFPHGVVPVRHPGNDPAHDPPHTHRTHDRLLPTPQTKSRRIMSASRQNHAIRRAVRLEKLLQALRGRQIHPLSHQAKLPNRRPPRVAAASNSGTANTKRIRERHPSLRACSTKRRSRSLRCATTSQHPLLFSPLFGVADDHCTPSVTRPFDLLANHAFDHVRTTAASSCAYQGKPE